MFLEACPVYCTGNTSSAEEIGVGDAVVVNGGGDIVGTYSMSAE